MLGQTAVEFFGRQTARRRPAAAFGPEAFDFLAELVEFDHQLFAAFQFVWHFKFLPMG
jgi:hypothetical protein